MKKVCRVALNGEEEAGLQALISKGKTSACKLTHARILLLAHAGEKDTVITRAMQTSVSTVPSMVLGLNMAGIELSLLSHRCFKSRLSDAETL